MKILSAEFVTSVADGHVPYDTIPQIVLVGRSNVGKSSLINALCRTKIARTSAAPGKTRLANVYRVTLEAAGGRRRAVYLVDLPGYGYARGGSEAAAELAAVAHAYFRGTDSVARSFSSASATQSLDRVPGARLKPRATGVAAGALLVVDARHPGLDSDLAAARWLNDLGVRRYVVATKIDKLSRAERARNLRTLSELFGAAALPVSAMSGEGLDELWKLMVRLPRTE